MSMHRHVPRLEDDDIELGGLGTRMMGLGLAVGVIALGAAAFLGFGSEDGGQRFAYAYLMAYAFYLSVALGALFFVAVGHVTRASWNVVSRRIGEAMAMNVLPMIVLFVPIVLMADEIFPWAMAHNEVPVELMEHKRPFLNLPFFYVRWVVYFLVWGGYATWFWRRSVKQDQSGDPKITMGLEKGSGLALLLYAVTVNIASYDLLMSLDPAWFSTMFGPYYFSGGVVAFFAALTLMTFFLQAQGRVRHVIHREHLHDYGKLLFAFVFFWAYLAFSQYMLIWYANIPEETAWLLRREENGWGWVGLVLLFGHFLLPFAGLLSRFAKRTRGLLWFWALWVFVVHTVDIYWIAMPELSPLDATPQLVDVLCWLGMGGLALASFARFAGAASLVPKRDPRLGDSLAFENA